MAPCHPTGFLILPDATIKSSRQGAEKLHITLTPFSISTHRRRGNGTKWSSLPPPKHRAPWTDIALGNLPDNRAAQHGEELAMRHPPCPMNALGATYSHPSATAAEQTNAGGRPYLHGRFLIPKYSRPNHCCRRCWRKPANKPVPLIMGLRLLTRLWEGIINAAALISSWESTLLDDFNATSMLRIDQPIFVVHSVNLLCWIRNGAGWTASIANCDKQPALTIQRRMATTGHWRMRGGSDIGEGAAIAFWVMGPIQGETHLGQNDDVANGGNDATFNGMMAQIFKESELPGVVVVML
jgi:hypothetical protein